MSFEEFNNFNDAQNFILENIHDYDELFLVVDTPDVFFVCYDEDDVSEFLIQSFHDCGSVLDSFERYQRNFDIYAYVTREQKERHPFLYRNAYWVGCENGSVFKQKMYAEAEYDISVSLSAY